MIKPLFSRGKEKTINNEKNIVITIKFFYKINNKVLIRQLNKSKDDNSNNINKFIMQLIKKFILKGKKFKKKNFKIKKY